MLKHGKKELNERKDEAIETLRAEGVHVESWFHLELEGQGFSSKVIARFGK